MAGTVPVAVALPDRRRRRARRPYRDRARRRPRRARPSDHCRLVGPRRTRRSPLRDDRARWAHRLGRSRAGDVRGAPPGRRGGAGAAARGRRPDARLPGRRAPATREGRRCPPTCSPTAARPASRWSPAAAGSTGRPGTTPTTSSSTRCRPEPFPSTRAVATARAVRGSAAPGTRARPRTPRDVNAASGPGVTVPALGMARWDAVSTVSTTGNDAVVDTAETPEHAAVRTAAQRAAGAAPGVRSAGGPGRRRRPAHDGGGAARPDRGPAGRERRGRRGRRAWGHDRRPARPAAAHARAARRHGRPARGARRHPRAGAADASSARCPRASGCSSGACPSG